MQQYAVIDLGVEPTLMNMSENARIALFGTKDGEAKRVFVWENGIFNPPGGTVMPLAHNETALAIDASGRLFTSIPTPDSGSAPPSGGVRIRTTGGQTTELRAQGTVVHCLAAVGANGAWAGYIGSVAPLGEEPYYGYGHHEAVINGAIQQHYPTGDCDGHRPLYGVVAISPGGVAAGFPFIGDGPGTPIVGGVRGQHVLGFYSHIHAVNDLGVLAVHFSDGWRCERSEAGSSWPPGVAPGRKGLYALDRWGPGLTFHDNIIASWAEQVLPDGQPPEPYSWYSSPPRIILNNRNTVLSATSLLEGSGLGQWAWHTCLMRLVQEGDADKFDVRKIQWPKQWVVGVAGEASGLSDDEIILATGVKVLDANNVPIPPANQKRHAVFLLPIELKDIKKVADPDDDVNIEDIGPKKSGETENQYIQRPLSNKQIAYIEPHGATNNTDPEMPHLVVKMPGPQGLKVRYKLLVEYKRGNGYRASYVKEFTRPEDTVKIPASGDYTEEMDADQEWRIFETEDWQSEITENGFFGGTAKLYIWFPSQGAAPTEPFMTFRIGGKNPDQTKAKTFINSEAGSQFWYAYAIAKHETFGRVRENNQNRYYNQFYTDYKGGPIGDASVDMGWAAWAKAWPLYNLDRGRRKDGTRYQNGPGGYGLFQLTLGPKEPDATIPSGGEGFIKRKEIWNWQDNARGAIEELQGKVSKAQSLRNALQTTYPSSGAIPNYGPFSGLDALTITFYNGMWGGELKPIAVNGYKKQQLTCWYPRSGGWAFLQNSNRYCEKVKAKLD